jgi:peptidoglycan DL-endopeptidase CwlO
VHTPMRWSFACAFAAIVITFTVTASPASARGASPGDHAVAAAALEAAGSLRALQAVSPGAIRRDGAGVDGGGVVVAAALPAAALPAEDQQAAAVARAEASRIAFADYDAKRLHLAEVVAQRAGADAAVIDAVWGRTDPRRAAAVFSGLSQLGTPYRYGGTRPGGFDCSGFTGYAWAAAGLELPRNSSAQRRASAARTTGELQPGDLVFRPGHVMMYLGVGDLVVHSPQRGRTVTIARWGRVAGFGSPLRGD